jgi:hypothetical protein
VHECAEIEAVALNYTPTFFANGAVGTGLSLPQALLLNPALSSNRLAFTSMAGRGVLE